MSNSPSIIINADDLGYSSGVNEAIFNLMALRRVTSATMLANAPEVVAAAKQSKQFPWCSFGVHLCLTEFEPLTPAGARLPFLDATGRFNLDRFETVRPDAAAKKNIAEEWCAQIKRLRDLGIQISHLDSHQHVHTRPWMFSVLKEVQRASGIRKARISMNFYYRPEHTPGPLLLLKKMIFNCALRNIYSTRTTAMFTNFRWYNLASKEKRPAAKSVELMTHPGNAGFQEETALLAADDFEDFRSSCRLINYDEL